jgi:hypothetical protein
VATAALADAAAPKELVQAGVLVDVVVQPARTFRTSGRRVRQLFATAENHRDDALLAWLSSGDSVRIHRFSESENTIFADDFPSRSEAGEAALDELLEPVSNLA